MNRAGDGEHLAVLFQRLPRGDQRAGLQRRFHHQDALRQAGNDAIASWKMRWLRFCAERKFTHNQTMFGNFVGQFLIARGVNDVAACPNHRDGGAGHTRRTAVGLERALMRGSVDAEREAGDDVAAALRQLFGEPLGVFDALRGGVATADDGQGARRTGSIE